ncbi:MAG: DNA-binding protein [Synergistaceae bacterium]|nr:DNA-binding protein [Synergistaceae bacterium]
MAEKDSLNQRVRDGLLLDNYGLQLTEKQRMACEMILMQDFSLSEAAETLGVSRQDVHDLITRAREHMEEYEKSFGLIARRQQMEQVLEENRERLPEDFYVTFKKILGA